MISTAALLLLAAMFFAIAALYAAAGFGGGSSYLAILALYLKDFMAIKTTGLLCNLVVVSGGTWLFRKEGYFDKARFLPVLLSGVPAAFFGATIHLQQQTFFIVLGSILSISGLLLLLQLGLQPAAEVAQARSLPLAVELLLGAGVGLLSGLVGIGGGILLSPVLNLTRWDGPKKIAALASCFILLNSLAGLAGQLVSGTFRLALPVAGILILSVFLGGQLGTRLSIYAVRPAVVRGLTGILVCYIGAKLVLKYANDWDI